MKLYLVRHYAFSTSVPDCSEGFGSRGAAERFAAGLAAAGKCVRASIESYDADDDDDEG